VKDCLSVHPVVIEARQITPDFRKQFSKKQTAHLDDIVTLAPWLMMADFDNAVIDFQDWRGNDCISWQSGDWYSGEWSGGVWVDGTWHNGIFEDGLWFDGEWLNGIWQDGIWKDGVWYNGTFEDGVWHNGLWKNGDWSEDAIWKRGIWEGGDIDGEYSESPPE